MGGSSSRAQTVGYKYYMGLHLIGCHGPVDSVSEIQVGERTAWSGDQTVSGSIQINAPNLFGGDEKEGGIQGTLDVMMGESTQAPNDYLTAQQGTPQPAYRGLLSLVFRKGLIASMNPYIKPWAVRVSRIKKGWANNECWYDERAAVPIVVLINAWNHVAMQCSNRDVSLYVGGKLLGQLTAPGSISVGESGNISIGRYRPDYRNIPPDLEYSGYIQNYRVTKAVRYSGNFVPSKETPSEGNDPFWSSVIVMLRMNGVDGGTSFNDEKGTSWSNGQLSGDVLATTSSAKSVAGGSSGYFPLRSVVYKPFSPELSLGTQWTLDFWMYPTVDLSSIQPGQAIFITVLWEDPNNQDYGSGLIFRSDGRLSAIFAMQEIYNAYQVPASVAMNPAHIIYQCITDPNWGMGYPTSAIDDASFRAAADTLYAEGFGLCLKWTNQTSIDDFVSIIADHAGLVLGQDRRTGLYRIVMLRNNYDVESLPVFNPSNARLVKYQRPALTDTVNEIIVKYRDFKTGKEATAAPAQNLANIQGQGRVVSQTRSYDGLPTYDLAARVAQRDLIAASTPLWKMTLEFDRTSGASNLLPGEPFVVDWPPLGINVVMRAGEINYGTSADSKITAECVEDVFVMPATSCTAEQETGYVAPNTAPQVSPATMAFEVSYRDLVQTLSSADLSALPADAGYLAAVAVRPTGVPINYGLYTRIDANDYVLVASGDFVPTAVLSADVNYLNTVLPIASAMDLEDLGVGTAAFLGNGVDAEMVRIDVVDLEAGAVTVGRGCGDTVPHAWPSGTRLWGFDLYNAADSAQYVDTELVNAKITPRSSDGELSVDNAVELSVTMASRQVRPYPPANFQIGGVAYPPSVVGVVAVTWSHRDRLLQADQLVDTVDADIGPEPNTTYTVNYYQPADTLVHTQDAISGTSATPYVFAANGEARITVESVRDSFVSWQKQDHTFDYTRIDPTATAIYNKIVSWWEFDEASGALLDAHSSGLDATGSDIAYNETGLAANLGKSVKFDASDYIEVADNVLLKPVGDLACMVWAKRNGSQGDAPKLLWKPGNLKVSGHANYALIQDNVSNAGKALFRVTVSNTNYDALTSAALSDATTYQLIGNRDGAEIAIWRNGTKEGTNTLPSAVSVIDTSSDALRWGNYIGSADNWAGWIDQSAVFNARLTNAEIAYLWNGGAGISYATLKAAAGF